jgi:hypothetical protein
VNNSGEKFGQQWWPEFLLGKKWLPWGQFSQNEGELGPQG